MSERLNGVRFKIERAKQHLHDLDAAVAKFTAPHPFRIDMNEIDNRTGERIARVVVKRQPPPILALIVGDLVHSLRTALDYAAWQLVDSNDGRPGRHTQYPISLTEEDFEKSGRRQLRGAAESAIRAVSLNQPFRIATPKKHPLWVLSDLDNRDKHRLLHVVGGVITRAGIGARPPGMSVENLVFYSRPRRFLLHGDLVARVKVSSGKPPLSVTFSVVLDAEEQSLREALMPLFAAVEQAVTEAAKYVS